MFKNKKNHIIFGAMFFAVAAFAQPKKPNLETPGQSVEKDFDITLNETERIKGDLSLPNIDTTTKAQKYNLSTRTFKVDYLPPKIRPIGMGSDKKSKNDGNAKNGYIKLGYGYPHSPYGEAGYAYNTDKFDASIALKHHSMNNKNVILQKFNETGGKLNLGYHLNKDYAAGAHIGYNQKGVWAYGALDSGAVLANIQPSYLSSIYKTTDFGLSIYNTSKNKADLTYSAAIDFSNLAGPIGSKELNTDIKLKATKWFAEKHPLSLMLHTDFNRFDYIGAPKKDELKNIFLVPSFTFHADAFSIKAGLNLVGNNDEWSPNPDLEITASILGDRLAIFGGWKGDVQKNTYHTLTNYNPFLLSSIQDNLFFGKRMQNTKFQDYFGGVKGHWGAIDYNVQGGYKPTKNLAFFLQNNDFKYTASFKNGRFDVIYGDANITYLKGSISAKVKSFEIGGTFSQNIYTMTGTTLIQKPWHLPSTEINGNIAYRLLEDKLKLRGQVFFQNGIPYLTDAGVAETLGTLVDVNIGTDYNFNKNFGIFLNVNNLLNQKRQRWYNYPSYGLNVLGGLVVRF